MSVVIWHNPACGTSRNPLARSRATGVEPQVVAYLDTPPSRAALVAVAAAVGDVRTLLRTKGTPATDLGLATASDEAILDAMLIHPILIERPVVFGPRGIVLARPSERVLEVLDAPLPAAFTKEDGEVVAPA